MVIDHEYAPAAHLNLHQSVKGLVTGRGPFVLDGLGNCPASARDARLFQQASSGRHGQSHPPPNPNEAGLYAAARRPDVERFT
jgi:hypothetical protein